MATHRSILRIERDKLRAEIILLKVEHNKLRAAALAVCWFDWYERGHDDDAVAAVHALRCTLAEMAAKETDHA